MKKVWLLLITLLLPLNICAEENMTQAKSSILMEYSTGKILYENNSKEQLAPASMTKIMSMLLIMEAIDNGKININDEVYISENASSMGGSQIFLQPNTKMKVHELLKGIAIASGNDAVVALAEKTYGTVDNFVKRMNERAEELNLVNTNFVNPHGLDANNHYSCAYDMAVMAKELIKHEKILDYTKIYEEYLTKEDGTKTWLVNTNKLVRFYDGVDGLKTGFTNQAGYCLTATAKKNDVRFITVVMGEATSDIRSKDTAGLLNYGFNNFRISSIIKKDTFITDYKLKKSKNSNYALYALDSLFDVIPLNDPDKKYQYDIQYNDLEMPIKKNTPIGYIVFKSNDEIYKVPIGSHEDIKKANFFDYLKYNILNTFTGIK